MFHAEIIHVHSLRDALDGLDAATLVYSPEPYPMLSVGSAAVLVNCADRLPASWVLSSQGLGSLKTLAINSLTITLKATASGLTASNGGASVVIAPPADAVESPSPTKQKTKRTASPSLPAHDSTLAAVAHKALAYGKQSSLVLRQGYCSLTFITGANRWVTVELLETETLYTIYVNGRAITRKRAPMMTAYALLRSLPFGSITLER